MLGKFLQKQPGYAKFVGIKPGAGGRVTPSELKTAARGRAVVRILPIRETGHPSENPQNAG